MKRFLLTQPAAFGAVAAAAWAIFQFVWDTTHGGGFDAEALYGLVGTALLAVYQAGWIHRKVTPLARPRTSQRVPLVPAISPGDAAYPPGSTP